MYFLYVAIFSLWKNAWLLIRTNLNSLYQKTLCGMFGWNWPSGSGEDFQKLSIFFTFLLISPLRKRARSFIWKKLNPFNLIQGYSVPSLVEIGPVVLDRKSSMYFPYVAISLWQRAWSFMFWVLFIECEWYFQSLSFSHLISLALHFSLKYKQSCPCQNFQGTITSWICEISITNLHGKTWNTY